MGRPSVDPELMIRMLIVAYCYGIRSERQLCDEVELHLAYRWFCRLDLDDRVPDHSTFSVNRHGRFRESDVFRHIFEGVVRACMDAGLVKGEGFAVDASVMEADASRYHSVKPEEADWSASERQTRAVAEFLGALKSKAGPAERHPGVLWKPQRFVQVRIVKNVPEMIDDLAISPKLIRKHKLDRSQHECEKCVVAVQQHGFYRRRTDEIA